MAKKTARTTSIRRLTYTAVLIALILLLTFTPLGYPKLGPVEPTIMMIPVAIGAILLGPTYGAILGLTFGLSSFATCFGYSAFGVALFTINPLATFVVCVLPRLLMGFLCGWIFRAVDSHGKHPLVASIVTSVSSALLNSVLFVSALLLFFRNVDLAGLNLNLGAMSVWQIILTLFLFNSIAEVALCGVVGTILSRVLARFLRQSI